MTDSEIVASRSSRRHHLARMTREEFGPEGTSGGEFISLMQGAQPRHLIVNRDIDGFVTATLLSQVTGWKIAAVVSGRKVILHPAFGSLDDVIDAGAFGVDVFSLRYPSISNHMQLIGIELSDIPAVQTVLQDHDRLVVTASRLPASYGYTPSIWAGVEASNTDDTSPHCRRYRYPMGSAQIALAFLESLGLACGVRDSVYTPMLIAHCDGALTTIVTAGYNVATWWDALAAAAGPGTWTWDIRQQVRDGASATFPQLVRSLHGEAPSVAQALTLEWNLSGSDKVLVHRTVVEWLMAENGWDDPFLPVAAATQPPKGPVRLTGLDGYHVPRRPRLWRERSLAVDRLKLDPKVPLTAAPLAASLASARAAATITTYVRDGAVEMLWHT